MGDFTFYGDESYGVADAYAVAGYVASVEQWEKFIGQWKAFREEEGFTVLHKRLLEHNRKEFEWPILSKEEKAEKKRRINTRACNLILNYVGAGAGLAVQKSTWRSVAAESKWAEAFGKSFYAAGVFGCLNLVSKWFEDRRKIGMIRYVFEEGAEGRDEAEKMLRRLKKDPIARDKFRIAGYSFESKEKPGFIPLQSADFLAYEGYRQIDNQVVNSVKLDKTGRPFNMRGAMRCLMRMDDPTYKNCHPDNLPTPHYVRWFDSQAIQNLIGGFNRRFPEGPAF